MLLYVLGDQSQLLTGQRQAPATMDSAGDVEEMDQECIEETAAGQLVQCRASGEVGCQQPGDRRHRRILEAEPWLCQRVALDGPAKPPRQRILVENG